MTRKHRVKLGVNIDHVATVREARKTFEPDPVQAAIECLKGGASGIVCHLRKDRRHISDKDIASLRKINAHLNMEMSLDPEIVDIACKTRPDQATIVPENRREVTTEGGLNVKIEEERIRKTIEKLSAAGIIVSLFIDPETSQIESAKKCGAGIIEFHTGRYAEAFNSGGAHEKELEILKMMTLFAIENGFTVCAGHGLHYKNTAPVARIKGMYELNIGHSIVSRAVFTGIRQAVKEMRKLIP